MTRSSEFDKVVQPLLHAVRASSGFFTFYQDFQQGKVPADEVSFLEQEVEANLDDAHGKLDETLETLSSADLISIIHVFIRMFGDTSTPEGEERLQGLIDQLSE